MRRWSAARRFACATGGDVRVCVATTPTITATDGGEAECGREAQLRPAQAQARQAARGGRGLGAARS